MEKIVMYLKKVIILLCGIVLGYLTSRRTDMSISLECILGDGVFIVLVITIIMVITKEKIKLGINCAIFGLSFVIGSTWIKHDFSWKQILFAKRKFHKRIQHFKKARIMIIFYVD